MLPLINRPFLKWAGGKRLLTPKISQSLPDGNRLIEPFVGAGSVFLNCHFPKYILSDINQDLINIYQILQKDAGNFVDLASQYFTADHNKESQYYLLREHFNQLPMGSERAAIFLYLNRHGFNGLCRYNQAGGYNVPYGKYLKPYFPEKEMHFFAKRASNAVFYCQDFVQVMKKAKKDTVIYCDPPYVPLNKTAYFTQYAQAVFGVKQQQKLAQLALSLREKGISTVISNHDNEVTRALYKEAEIESFYVQRTISCEGSTRNKVKELLAVYRGK